MKDFKETIDTVWKDNKHRSKNDEDQLDLDSSLKRLQKLERNLRRLGIGGAYGNSGTRPRKKSQSLERVISFNRADTLHNLNAKKRAPKTPRRSRIKSADYTTVHVIPPREKKKRKRRPTHEKFGGKVGASSLITGRVRGISRSKSKSKSTQEVIEIDDRASFRRSRSRDLHSEDSEDSTGSGSTTPSLPPLPEKIDHRCRSRRVRPARTPPLTGMSDLSLSSNGSIGSTRSRKQVKNRLSISSAHTGSPGIRSRSMPYIVKEARRSPSPGAMSTLSYQRSVSNIYGNGGRSSGADRSRKNQGNKRRKKRGFATKSTDFSSPGELPIVNMRSLRQLTQTSLITGDVRR